MYHEKLTPQAAVQHSIAMIHDCYERFYEEERELYEEIEPENLDNMKEYLQVFKDLVMCNLHWR